MVSHTAYPTSASQKIRPFSIHNDPNIAQGIIGVECLSFPSKTEADAQADAVFRLSDGSLLQLHEEQDEDRPDPDSYWKLRRLCVSQKGPSSWNRKSKQEHSHSREYPED
jgi:hypothetical protein